MNWRWDAWFPAAGRGRRRRWRHGLAAEEGKKRENEIGEGKEKQMRENYLCVVYHSVAHASSSNGSVYMHMTV